MKMMAVPLIIALAASPVGAIELSLVGNDRFGEDFVEVGLSETATVSVWMDMGADDGNVWAWSVFFDATPFGRRSTDGYDVIGRKFTLARNDGQRWDRVPGAFGPDIEFFHSVAEDSWGPGTKGPWRGAAENLFIHGTQIGEYELYFENRVTFDRDWPRSPGLVDSDNRVHPYARNLDLPEFIHFRNAWIDEEIGFDVPFRVIVVPEPSTVVLMSLAAAGLLVRRIPVHTRSDNASDPTRVGPACRSERVACPSKRVACLSEAQVCWLGRRTQRQGEHARAFSLGMPPAGVPPQWTARQR